MDVHNDQSNSFGTDDIIIAEYKSIVIHCSHGITRWKHEVNG